MDSSTEADALPFRMEIKLWQILNTASGMAMEWLLARGATSLGFGPRIRKQDCMPKDLRHSCFTYCTPSYPRAALGNPYFYYRWQSFKVNM